MHGPVDTKMCSRCLHVKPVADFYREGNSGKHRYECKTCDYERWKIWFSQPHNRKKKSAWLRRYYLQHYEEALAKRRKYHRGYYLKNRETLHLKHRNYRTSPRGREVSRELTKKWKARVRGPTQTPFALTLEQWKGLLQEFGHACAWCGASFTDRNRPEQDHIVPVSKGGCHAVDNVVPACRSCNARWRDKEKPLPSAWLAFHRERPTQPEQVR